MKYGTYEVELPQDYDDEVQENIAEAKQELKNVAEDVEEVASKENE